MIKTKKMAAPCRLKLVWLVLFFASLVPQISTNPFKEDNKNYKLIHLDEFPIPSGNLFQVKPPGNGEPKLCVFCYPGQGKTFYRLWTNPKLYLASNDGEDVRYQVFYGDNEQDVLQRSKASSYIPWPSLPFAQGQFGFNPFNASCVGIASEQSYTLEFTVKNPCLMYMAMTTIGLLLFFSARAWSGNVALHYSVGVSAGVFGSVLILVFVLIKFLPQKLKTLTYVVGAVSTSVSLWLYQHMSSYFNHILVNNWKIACGYVLVSGLVSFAVVYRYGPVTNPRSLDLVRWLLQGLGLALVYHSSHLPQMSVAIILLSLASYHIPHRLWPALKHFRYRYFPPQRRLLTEEEYRVEADVETTKALEDLRQYCLSPGCNPWKTVSCLASPSKFAQFMEGDSHLSDDEYERHVNESEILVNHLAFTDDSGGSSEGEEEEEEEEEDGWRRRSRRVSDSRPGSSHGFRNGGFKRS